MEAQSPEMAHVRALAAHYVERYGDGASDKSTTRRLYERYIVTQGLVRREPLQRAVTEGVSGTLDNGIDLAAEALALLGHLGTIIPPAQVTLHAGAGRYWAYAELARRLEADTQALRPLLKE